MKTTIIEDIQTQGLILHFSSQSVWLPLAVNDYIKKSGATGRICQKEFDTDTLTLKLYARMDKEAE